MIPFPLAILPVALLVALPAAAQQRMTPQNSAAPNQAMTPASPPPTSSPVVGPPTAGASGHPGTAGVAGGHAGAGAR